MSVASDFGAMWAALSVLQVLRGRRALSSAAVTLASSGVASVTLTRCLKHYFAVPRQVQGERVTLARTPSSSGFPSGHTVAAFTSALTIPVQRRGTYAALGFAALVAWARVRVGHHRTADVVVGAGAGVLAGLLLRWVLTRPRPQPP